MAESGVRHEVKEVDARAVLWGGAAIASGIVLAAVAAYLLWHLWGAPSGAQPYGGPNTGNVPEVAAPVLQSAPQPERARFDAEKRRLLDSWGWVDRRAGIARIPIEEAMRVMASRRDAGQGEEK